MFETIEYSNIKGNRVTLVKEDYDYSVYLNDTFIMTTGDEAEAQMVAESTGIALSILDTQKKLTGETFD
jgi:hypothetical protein